MKRVWTAAAVALFAAVGAGWPAAVAAAAPAGAGQDGTTTPVTATTAVIGTTASPGTTVSPGTTTDPDTSAAAATTAGPGTTAASTSSTAASTTTTDPGDPTTGETVAAVVALGAGLLAIVAIVVLVMHAHGMQRSIARQTVAGGGSVAAAVAPAAGGAEVAPAATDTPAPAPIPISGPDRLAVGVAGEFTVPEDVAAATWTVTGITSYARAEPTPRTFVLTPGEVVAAATVSVTAGARSGTKQVQVVPAERTSFVARFATRNWGLVVVAVAVVFVAGALGFTGHLDGANFVALVAPLAALLGVTAAVAPRDGGSGGQDGGSPGGG